MFQRPELSDESLLKAIEAVTVKMGEKIEKKGKGIKTSSHEVLGDVTEEYDELLDAVRGNDNIEIAQELQDIAVACILGLASFLEMEEKLKEAKKKLKESTENQ